MSNAPTVNNCIRSGNGHDGREVVLGFNVVFKPLQLISTQISQFGKNEPAHKIMVLIT